MREIVITAAQDGQRFDRFLNRYLPGASTGFLHKMLRKKNIKLNQGKAEGNEKLKCGDKIQIYFSEETFEKFAAGNGGEDRKASFGTHASNAASFDGKAELTGKSGLNAEGRKSGLRTGLNAEGRRSGLRTGLNAEGKGSGPRTGLSREALALRRQVRLIYQSKDLAVFHKPAGMLTQKASREDDSLNDYLLDFCLKEKLISQEDLITFRPAAANRLDRNTSGMVLCGLSIRGLQLLSRMLHDRELKKYYYCIVKGSMERNAGKIRGYLVKDEKTNVVSISKEKVEGASYIATDYQLVCANAKASLLKIELITGKSHQIRAHLASIGHPVAGDYKYGDRRFNDSLKRELGINYQMLHSCELIFPKTKELEEANLAGLHLTDPMPADFKKVREYFGLWQPGTREV